jgi:hypothetical protein
MTKFSRIGPGRRTAGPQRPLGIAPQGEAGITTMVTARAPGSEARPL